VSSEPRGALGALLPASSSSSGGVGAATSSAAGGAVLLPLAALPASDSTGVSDTGALATGGPALVTATERTFGLLVGGEDGVVSAWRFVHVDLCANAPEGAAAASAVARLLPSGRFPSAPSVGGGGGLLGGSFASSLGGGATGLATHYRGLHNLRRVGRGVTAPLGSKQASPLALYRSEGQLERRVGPVIRVGREGEEWVQPLCWTCVHITPGILVHATSPGWVPTRRSVLVATLCAHDCPITCISSDVRDEALAHAFSLSPHSGRREAVGLAQRLEPSLVPFRSIQP